ncbi:MAG: hypothetical protein B9S32_05855 [Verrucomicrobia bacterium Tous-C9LFEB]|nr:MAG: hypothetical protein B9S32_05855 [Verrucomicrobia bacterium Tous-C9LFEB]
MKNYIRFIWKGFAPGVLLALLLGASQSSGAVLTLDFADGNGTTSVDQYMGTAGSGWKGGWTTATTGSSSTNTVTNGTPLYTGGNNYLQASYIISATGQNERVTRQVDSTAINLSSLVTYSFTFRSDVSIGGSGQYLAIVNATGPTSGTGPSNTWEITADGGGWKVGGVALGFLGGGTGTDYQFTINSDPISKTYNVTILNLNNLQSVTSVTANYRNALATTENTYLNFISTATGTALVGSTIGFSIDNISVVPEPNSMALIVASCALFAILGKGRRFHTL